MSLNFQQNISLVPYSTFRLAAAARFYVQVASIEQLQELCLDEHFIQYPHLILGGGSNTVFSKNYDGLVIGSGFMGMEIIEDTTDFCVVRCGGGESWQALVDFSLLHNLGGIENLTLIPGTVGASPVQNIGAYGQELRDTVYRVECFDFSTAKTKILSNSECEFGYRTSVFKHKYAGNIFITALQLKLAKNPIPNLSYAPIAEQFSQVDILPTIAQVSQAIATIRRTKLPDSQVIANCGSFFKNPVLSAEVYSKLSAKYPDIPGFMQADGKIKMPGAWLIEQTGWKGKRIESIGTYPTQPLVLVNYGEAQAEELFAFVDMLQNDVFAKFGVFLEPEVNIV